MLDIDCIFPRQIARVQSDDEIVEVLYAANAASAVVPQVVVPMGGGTSLAIGNVPTRVDVVIDLSDLSGVSNYNPADLTLTVRAGTRLRDLQAELAQQGQELPIDMPLSDRATIGGLIATAFAGPRRYGAGTLKDALIGSSFVRGDGLAAKAGGMVVKNVSGFEMSRFLHGSWGSLAVITSANFKVTPIPKADRTLVIPFASIGEAITGFREIAKSGVGPQSAEILADHGETALILRVLGRAAGVGGQSQLLTAINMPSPQRTFEQEESSAFWTELGNAWAVGGADVQLSIGVRPRDVLAAVTSLTSAPGPAITRMLVSPGTGSIHVCFNTDSLPPNLIDSFLQPIRNLPHGSAYVEFAPVIWKQHIDVWGPRPSSFGLMTAVKQQFDPAGILNRGRMVV